MDDGAVGRPGLHAVDPNRVGQPEPLPADHPFWDVPGLKVLPHIGGMHPERDKIVAELFIRNLQAYLNGEPQTAVVDFSVGY